MSNTLKSPTTDQYLRANRFSYYLEKTVASTPEDRARYAAAMYGAGKYNMLLLNNTAVHAAPIFVQELFNAMNKRAVGEDAAGANLVPFLHLLPRTWRESEQQLQIAQFQIASGVLQAFAFIACFGLVFIVVEKEAEIKTQQFVNGVFLGVSCPR